MYKYLLSFAFMAFSAFCVSAEDTLSVSVPNVPLLNGEDGNILSEIRTVAGKGISGGIGIRFSDDTDMKEITSLAIYREDNDSVPLDIVRYPSSRSVFLNVADVPDSACGAEVYRVTVGISEGARLEEPLRFSVEGTKGERRKAVSVRTGGDDGAAAYRIPGIVTTSDGTLVAVYDVRYESSADLQGNIKVGVSRSNDGGRTWEPMRLALDLDGYGGLPAAQNGTGDPCILYDSRNDRLWIAALWCHGMPGRRAWTASGQGLSPDETGQLLLVSSEDGGMTWSEPVNITPMVKDESWYLLLQGPGRGITMSDGTLVFPAQFIDSEKVPNATVVYSRDAGRTWAIGSPARRKTTESQVVEYPDGTLMLNMRDDRGGSRAVSVSRDMGATWSEHPSSRSALREPVCMASLIAVRAGDNITGKDLLLFSNPDSSVERKDITIKLSLDGGLTWPAAHQVVLDEGYGWGYSCLTMIDESTVGILYESSVANITFQAVPLKDFFE